VAIAQDRKALITGGASGFGLATGLALADAGASVVIADTNQVSLDKAVAADPRLTAIAMDVTDSRSVKSGVATAERHLGGLDTLVLSAGIIHLKAFEEVSEADWDLTIDVNLKGAFLVSQAAQNSLTRSGRGRIVAIASDAARRGYPKLQAYCASKFGLVGLCESLATEWAHAQVTVNTVCPAACPTTGMGRSLVQSKAAATGRTESEVLADIARTYPLERYVNEADVVGAILYLISDEAGFVTGVSLDIDGGAHLGHTPGLTPGPQIEA
jgi:meso-butanediol dehydrogenase / (S,S)-butanediol dehydrogenase / diacetyl reductase